MGSLGSGVGCREAEPDQLWMPLAELPIGGRLELNLAGVPVELRRTETGLEARSLLCTHMGCPVSWREDQGDYYCPCHEGRFDPSGRVLGGPPLRALSRVPVRVDAGKIVIG